MNTQPLLILGSTGQIGQALSAILGKQALALSRAEADLAHPEALPALLDNIRPRTVINAAAYTQVDRAEQEESLAHIVNGTAPGVIAQWCAIHDVPFVHYSTDYVYPGNGSAPWREDVPPAPLNAYGRSKLAGDSAVARAGGKWLILRTSWVYDHAGKNFPNTIIRLAHERETLRIIADQYGAPSYAPDLAKATLAILSQAQNMPKFPSGIYHLCNAGETTWHEFATQIISEMQKRGMQFKTEKIVAITTNDYPTPAQRPLNSRLNSDKLAQTFGISLPHWEDALIRCLQTKYS